MICEFSSGFMTEGTVIQVSKLQEAKKQIKLVRFTDFLVRSVFVLTFSR